MRPTALRKEFENMRRYKLLLVPVIILLLIFWAGPKQSINHGFSADRAIVNNLKISFGLTGSFSMVDRGWYDISLKGSPYRFGIAIHVPEGGKWSATLGKVILRSKTGGAEWVLSGLPIGPKAAKIRPWQDNSHWINFSVEDVLLPSQDYNFYLRLQICNDQKCEDHVLEGEFTQKTTKRWGLRVLDMLLSV
jgi:hypothetical protein